MSVFQADEFLHWPQGSNFVRIWRTLLAFPGHRLIGKKNSYLKMAKIPQLTKTILTTWGAICPPFLVKTSRGLLCNYHFFVSSTIEENLVTRRPSFAGDPALQAFMYWLSSFCLLAADIIFCPIFYCCCYEFISGICGVPLLPLYPVHHHILSL